MADKIAIIGIERGIDSDEEFEEIAQDAARNGMNIVKTGRKTAVFGVIANSINNEYGFIVRLGNHTSYLSQLMAMIIQAGIHEDALNLFVFEVDPKTGLHKEA